MSEVLDPRGGGSSPREVLDRIAAAVGLLVLLPVLAVLAILVKLTSRGPAFYFQTRVGRGGRLFRIVKFRSMRVDAEARTGPVWASAADPRVTPIGRWLRTAHLDELPQLVNVARGEMGFVGPRPERPAFVEELAKRVPGYRRRLEVRPGVTGLAQVLHDYDRDLETVRRKVAYDRLYLRRRSLLLDTWIVWRTAVRLVRNGLRPLLGPFRPRTLPRVRRGPRPA